jgi:transcriptional regulator
MHIQTHFEESRPIVLHELIRAQPLATFIVVLDGEIVVNHMPFIVAADEGDCGVLRAHLPIGNSLWQALNGPRKAVAVFQGPSSYITPSWYPSKHQHGKAVPTWNYVVVHAHGRQNAIQDPAWLLDHVNEMTNKQESAQGLPWKVSDAPEDFTDKMLSRIVGIEMPISSLQGKWKVSQNRPEADRLGVAAGLLNQGDESSLAMEALVRQSIDSLSE